MVKYIIYFKNLDGRLDMVMDGSTNGNIYSEMCDEIDFHIRRFENEQPELLENGEYIAIINGA